MRGTTESALTLGIDALAAFRVTRLVTADDITAPLRDAIEVRAARVASDRLAEFIVCPWCVGMWVAAGVAIARARFPRTWGALARILGISAAVGLLAER